MRRIAELFAPHCPSMQLIACSSDPDSLDAVILPEWKVSIADGTAPHILEPKQPALSESLLCFSSFLDPLLLMEHADTIRSISQATAKNYAQAIDCLSAAKLLALRQDCTELPAKRKAGSLCPPFFLQAFSLDRRGGERRFSNSINARAYQPYRAAADFARMSTSSQTGGAALLF